jgi:hypothetical protein
MFFQTVFVSLLALLLGGALCSVGYRLFVILLPIWAFFAGFSATATGVTAIMGTRFLATVLSWVLGLVVGLVFAVLAYLFYYAAIIILAGTVGYYLGVGVMTWIGFKLGLLTALVGLALALIFAAGAVLLRVPKLVIIVLTSLAGAAATLTGVYLAIGRIALPDLQWGAVGAVIRGSWVWSIIFVVLAALGILVQSFVTARRYVLTPQNREIAFVTTTGWTESAEPSSSTDGPTGLAGPSGALSTEPAS